MNLEDVLPFVPLVGPSYAVRQAYAQEYTTEKEIIEGALGIAIPTFVSFAVTYELLGERALTRFQVEGMRAVVAAAPAVAIASAVTAAAAAVAIPYERKVNRPIRKGTKGTFFGPYASGFGAVV